ncbi:M23 family metallopeptidase [Sorangium sp. So ce513]|uniref:M23 family metallopeptidase n=1 Tax=Sorangium sp. So ce513 TaxID=3133315 RepID=UPI003F623574
MSAPPRPRRPRRPRPRTAAAAPLAAAAALALLPGVAAADPFSYHPAGELVPGSGAGRADGVVYAPMMRFPLEEGPAFANSQVYSKGGSAGPRGGQCDADNYTYPWRDNYCESRSWDMPLCPSGAGHQGQDLRPPTCEAGKHWVVAVADGTITNIGGYSVYLTGEDGTRYDYLHMSDVQVSVGQDVSRGERIGKVSNVFGGTPTTIHLHFNVRQALSGVGMVYVPPYTSLVASYQALLNKPPEGALELAGCKGIRGWTRDPDAEGAPVSARLYFDAAATDAGAEGHTLPADRHRDDLCAPLGACAHGFEAPMPLSLLGGEHAVRAYGVDTLSGEEVELEGSPQALSCPLELPDGVRRPLGDVEALGAWGFSRFWDVAAAPDAALEALPEGDAFPPSPLLVRGDDGEAAVWLVDGLTRRPVPDAEIAAAWRLDPGDAVEWPAARLSALPLGPALPPRPFLAQGSGPALYVIDTAPPQGEGGGAASTGSGGHGGAGGAGGEGGAGGATKDVPHMNGGIHGQVRCECGAAGAGSAVGAAAGWQLGLLAALAALGAARRRSAQRSGGGSAAVRGGRGSAATRGPAPPALADRDSSGAPPGPFSPRGS